MTTATVSRVIGLLCVVLSACVTSKPDFLALEFEASPPFRVAILPPADDSGVPQAAEFVWRLLDRGVRSMGYDVVPEAEVDRVLPWHPTGTPNAFERGRLLYGLGADAVLMANVLQWNTSREVGTGNVGTLVEVEARLVRCASGDLLWSKRHHEEVQGHAGTTESGDRGDERPFEPEWSGEESGAPTQPEPANDEGWDYIDTALTIVLGLLIVAVVLTDDGIDTSFPEGEFLSLEGRPAAREVVVHILRSLPRAVAPRERTGQHFGEMHDLDGELHGVHAAFPLQLAAGVGGDERAGAR